MEIAPISTWKFLVYEWDGIDQEKLQNNIPKFREFDIGVTTQSLKVVYLMPTN